MLLTKEVLKIYQLVIILYSGIDDEFKTSQLYHGLQAQKCRAMLSEEQASSRAKDEKIQKLEQLTQQTSSKQARQYHTQQSCAQEMQRMNLLPRELLHDLAIDGGEQKPSLQGDEASSCLQAMGSSNSSSSSTKLIRLDSDSLSFDDDDAKLVCPRCEREFKQSERMKFEEHMSKCTDD